MTYPHQLLKKRDFDWVSSYPKKSKYAQLILWQRTLLSQFDPRTFGIPNENILKYIYSYSEKDSISDILPVKCLDHTMYLALDEYVSQKLPIEYIRTCILERTKIEIHGIYPSHFSYIADFLGFYDIQQIQFKHNPSQKYFNFIRPTYSSVYKKTGEKIFMICVTPGRDYLSHYASMIRHLVSNYTRDSDKLLKIYRYPFVEDSIQMWSSLDNKIIHSGDTVIIGYVKEFEDYIKRNSRHKYISSTDTDYYTSQRLKLQNGKIINLLGVKFSFWGSISAKICYQLCRLGAKEILYFGKLGALTSPNDLYKKVFIPSKYIIMYHDKLICKIDDLPNNFLAANPTLSTEYHVSVPTVLEEDYVQRSITSELKVNSIDNEISQIAYAIRKYNQEFNCEIAFSALHFATDYVRQFDKPELETGLDLSNNRTGEAREKKEYIIDHISEMLLNYLNRKDQKR